MCVPRCLNAVPYVVYSNRKQTPNRQKEIIFFDYPNSNTYVKCRKRTKPNFVSTLFEKMRFWTEYTRRTYRPRWIPRGDIREHVRRRNVRPKKRKRKTRFEIFTDRTFCCTPTRACRVLRSARNLKDGRSGVFMGGPRGPGAPPK